MNHEQFTDYLSKRLQEVMEHPADYPDGVSGQLESLLKLQTVGGPAARRARRDYIRRLARQGIDLNARIKAGSAL